MDCGTSCVTCCAVLLEPHLLDIMIVQFRNEKLVIMALYRSPLTVTLWPSSFLKNVAVVAKWSRQQTRRQRVKSFDPSTTEDPPCRGGRYTLNMLRIKRSPIGVVWKLGERGVSLVVFLVT
ncbi:hypothetical protein TNCV_1744241 [Trichonephila clavipes]|nr:hypothetical protein TNCV_1744241 [Trichonephila clavipes]